MQPTSQTTEVETTGNHYIELDIEPIAEKLAEYGIQTDSIFHAFWQEHLRSEHIILKELMIAMHGSGTSHTHFAVTLLADESFIDLIKLGHNTMFDGNSERIEWISSEDSLFQIYQLFYTQIEDDIVCDSIIHTYLISQSGKMSKM